MLGTGSVDLPYVRDTLSTVSDAIGQCFSLTNAPDPPILFTHSLDKISIPMAPSIEVNIATDFQSPIRTTSSPALRTLLLSPPSLSSHPEKLNNVTQSHDRSVTDIQMLDRLSIGLVSLPEDTYDTILVLSDADGSRRESQTLLGREVLTLLAKSLKASGCLKSQDRKLGAADGAERNECILSGLTFEPGNGFIKPASGAHTAVPLRLRGKNATAQAAGGLQDHKKDTGLHTVDTKRKHDIPDGVGFDDGNMIDSDDELIDEDALLDDEDFRQVKIRESRFFLASILSC